MRKKREGSEDLTIVCRQYWVKPVAKESRCNSE